MISSHGRGRIAGRLFLLLAVFSLVLGACSSTTTTPIPATVQPGATLPPALMAALLQRPGPPVKLADYIAIPRAEDLAAMGVSVPSPGAPESLTDAAVASSVMPESMPVSSIGDVAPAPFVALGGALGTIVPSGHTPRDKRWTAILAAAKTQLKSPWTSGYTYAHPIALYTAALVEKVSAKRRADGSFNPADLPSTIGLSVIEKRLLQLADSVPAQALCDGNNEGVPGIGKSYRAGDNYDVLATIKYAQDKLAAAKAAFAAAQAALSAANAAKNGAAAGAAQQQIAYQQTQITLYQGQIDTFTVVARSNQKLCTLRWQLRWSMLRANSYGKIADAEQASITLPSATAPIDVSKLENAAMAFQLLGGKLKGGATGSMPGSGVWRIGSPSATDTTTDPTPAPTDLPMDTVPPNAEPGTVWALGTPDPNASTKPWTPGSSTTPVFVSPSPTASPLAIDGAVDNRWSDILARSAAALAAGPVSGPYTASNPIPLYAIAPSTDAEARRRADGSLNPQDLPSTLGLTDAQILILRLANSVPSAALGAGQNEGTPIAGHPQALNDSFDLFAWISKLKDGLAAGSMPLDNGMSWNTATIERNLEYARAQVAANKQLYNVRWMSRWAMLEQNGLADMAAAERSTISFAVVDGSIPGEAPDATTGTTGSDTQLSIQPFGPPIPVTDASGAVAGSSLGGSTSSFVEKFGDTPSNIAEKALKAIMAAGKYGVDANGAYHAKTLAEWEALMRQFGGEAAVVAFDVQAAVPNPITGGSAAAGVPTSAAANTATYFTGVVGTTNNQGGITYGAYLNGKLIAKTDAGGNFDTAAWGASVGLNPYNWYASKAQAPAGAQSTDPHISTGTGTTAPVLDTAQALAATGTTNGAPSATSLANLATSGSAFVAKFGDSPYNIWDATLAKIQAAGLYRADANGAYHAKTPDEWEALAKQYGGEAAVAAYDVEANPPSAVTGQPTLSQGAANVSAYFTGVVGTTNAQGTITYSAYLNGKQIASTTGGGNFDTAAFGASAGLNPSNWYASTGKTANATSAAFHPATNGPSDAMLLSSDAASGTGTTAIVSDGLTAFSTQSTSPTVPLAQRLGDPRLLTLSPKTDPRWATILAGDLAALSRANGGPTSATNLNPLYAAVLATDPAAAKGQRADGSLNPNDLPSTQGLTPDQLLLARIAESVPSEALKDGQNEGVTKAGQSQNVNDSYDLLAWQKQLTGMAAGTLAPFVQSNGYVWTKDDIARNLDIANGQIAQNKYLYSLRWESHWQLLRDNGFGAVADAEEKKIKLGEVATGDIAISAQSLTIPEVSSDAASSTDPNAPSATDCAAAAAKDQFGTDAAKCLDPRWNTILQIASSDVAAGAVGQGSDANHLIALYTGVLKTTPDAAARQRSDGSLNPNDLPSSLGLSPDQYKLAVLANSVPNAVLATGQNEGVAKPGATQNINDSYDLLAWQKQLADMAAGKVPPLKQSNGYVWTPTDIARNLDIANGQIAQNKQLYDDRWQTRWALLEQMGMKDVADKERAENLLVPVTSTPGTPPPAAGSASGASSAGTPSPNAQAIATNEQYIANLTSALKNTTDPAKRAALQAQIATKQSIIAKLQGAPK